MASQNDQNWIKIRQKTTNKENSEHLVASGMMHLAQRWCDTRQPVNMLNTDDIDYLLPVGDSAPQAVHLVYELRCLGYTLAVGWTNQPLALGDMTILDTFISAVGDVKRTADQVASLQRCSAGAHVKTLCG